MHSSRSFPPTSDSLLARLRNGAPQDNWREFFKCYAPPIFRAARQHGLSADDADDIVQQVMTAICSHISDFRYDRDRGRFRNWVRRIADRQIANLYRRRRPNACDPSLLDARECDVPTADELWDQQWELQDLHYCLEQIENDVSPRQMEAFRLYALEGRSAKETAEAVGMTVGSIYVTRNFVLNLLRCRIDALKRQEEDR